MLGGGDAWRRATRRPQAQDERSSHREQSQLTSTHPSLIERLRAVVGDAGLVFDAERQAVYLTDWPRKWTGRTPVVVRPNSTEETAAVMRICHETRTPVVPQGGNTGMTGAGIPDMDGAQIIVSMNR